jgi:cytoskeletal protein CcmA (bactofilin family)
MPARAVEFTNDGTIAAGEVVDDDLFISAEEVVIDGTVNGDLFINSSTAFVGVNGIVNGNLIVNSASLTLNGSVSGSLVFAGQFAVIRGNVAGTVYAAGNSVKLEQAASVGRNLFFAGFSLHTAEGATVGRDILLTGYQLIHNGAVERNLTADVVALEVGGRVGRDVNAKVEAPRSDAGFFYSLPFFQSPGAPVAAPPGLRVAGTAQIGGKLTYTSPVEQAKAIQAQPQAGVAFHLAEQNIKFVREVSFEALAGHSGALLARFKDLVTLLILGSLLIWWIPDLFRRTSQQARAAFWPALGWGVFVCVGGFLGALVLALLILLVGILTAVVSLGGLSRAVFSLGLSGLGLAFSIFLISISFGSKLVVAQLGGRMILERLAPASAENRFWPLALGVFIYVLLRGIPLLGWLVGVFTTLLGLGAIWLILRQYRK